MRFARECGHRLWVCAHQVYVTRALLLLFFVFFC